MFCDWSCSVDPVTLLRVVLIYAGNGNHFERTTIFPEKMEHRNYVTVIRSSKILRFMLNSLVVSLVSSISRVITASMAAYAFTFFEFKGKKILFAMVVGSMIIPAEMLMVQNYFTTAELNLINTYMGMSIIFMVSCANIFLIRQNFRGFAAGVREAALVDGCGNWRFFSQFRNPFLQLCLFLRL